MNTLNIPVEEFVEFYEKYDDDDHYISKKDGQVVKVKYEDESYFVVEPTKIKVRDYGKH